MTIVMFRRAGVAVWLPVWLAAGAAAWGHPAGRFSVNHYTRLTAGPAGIAVRYVVEWAELPALETARRWGVTPGDAEAALQAPAATEMRSRLGELVFSADGRRAEPALEQVRARWGAGDGGKATLRLEADLRVAGPPGRITFEDRSDAGRSGWREIVIRAGAGAALTESSQDGSDRSRELTVFPDPGTMPRERTARLAWRAGAADGEPARVPAPPETRVAEAGEAPPPSPASSGGGGALEALVAHGELTPWWAATALLVAFGYGAAHALSPGHGKAIVAAYLVGSRGTVRHALLLGGLVTFTHTISVFALGVVTLFLSQFILPDQMARTLRLASGLSIAAIGGWLLLQRLGLAGHGHSHEPAEGGFGEGPVTFGSLAALAASGGLVPCPSALVLLLTAVAVERTGFGLLLLVAFSLGLAGVLTAIGAMVVVAKRRLPASESLRESWLFRVVPTLSAAVILAVGIGMTGIALGWWPAGWLGE